VPTTRAPTRPPGSGSGSSAIVHASLRVAEVLPLQDLHGLSASEFHAPIAAGALHAYAAPPVHSHHRDPHDKVLLGALRGYGAGSVEPGTILKMCTCGPRRLPRRSTAPGGARDPEVTHSGPVPHRDGEEVRNVPRPLQHHVDRDTTVRSSG
jgi:hypothetical protein